MAYHAPAGRTVESVRADLEHLMSQHNTSEGLMRVGGRPVYFVYDSYRLPADEWARLLGTDGNITVRGTELDGELMLCTLRYLVVLSAWLVVQ
jgi:glycoprotein endo-alpha-1,2-mannosidase